CCEDSTTMKQRRRPVDIMVETEAEAGASGYSVTGGGERGIFVKDVLRDSPAAKHLSLQQGDQLLSAKVYFDNVRYEDALRILQCAEPYKVSFQLRRTVPEAEVSVRPRVPSVEVKGPKAKVAKMVIRGTFLAKLKEKNKDERVIEGTPPELDSSDVDVEFSLPKLKQKGKVKGPSVDFSLPKPDGNITGKDLNKMPSCDTTLPNVKLPQGEIVLEGPKVKENFEKPNIDVSVPQGLMEGVKLPSVDISLPKVELPEAGVKLKGPEIPNVEYSLPNPNLEGNLKYGDHETGRFKLPNVDVSLPKLSTKVGGVDIDEIQTKGEIDMPSLEFSGLKVKSPDVDVEIKAPDVKGGKMPSLDVPLPQIQSKDDDIGIKAPDLKLKSLKGDLDVKAEAGMDGKETKLKMPSFDVSPGKIKIPEGKVSLPKSETKGLIKAKNAEFRAGEIKKPTFEISSPQKTLEGDISLKGKAKGAKINVPSADQPNVKLPEGDLNLQGPKVKSGKFEMPKINVGKTEGSVDAGIGKHVKIEMASIGSTDIRHKTKCDVSIPKVNMPEGDIETKGLNIKGKTPQMRSPEMDVHLQGPDLSIPSVGISLPKAKGDVESGGVQIKGPDIKGKKIEMPDIDVSLPKSHLQEFSMPTVNISLPKINTKGSEVKLETSDLDRGKIKIPNVDLTLSKGSAEVECLIKADVDIESPKGYGCKVGMPLVNVRLPEVQRKEGDVRIKAPSVNVRNIEMPDIDVSVPKSKAYGEIEGGKFQMPSLDISFSKMKAKEPDINAQVSEIKKGCPNIDINLKGPDVKGGKIKIPTVDFSLPTGNIEGEFDTGKPDVKGGTFNMPKFDVSMPKVSFPKIGAKVEGPEMEGKMRTPTGKIVIPEGKADIDLDFNVGKESKFNVPSFDISLPKIQGKSCDVDFQRPKVTGDFSLSQVKSPELDISIKGPEGGMFNMPDVDISLPKGKIQGDIGIESHDLKGSKFEMPKVDVSLPKVRLPETDVKIQSPDVKGIKIEMPDIKMPKGKVEIEGYVGKDSKFQKSSIDIILPKIKSEGPKMDIKGSNLKEGKITMPDIDLSVPKEKLKADVSFKGPQVIGGEVKLPKVDVGLPKINMPKSDCKMEEPEIKLGQVTVPGVDIEVPIEEGTINVKGPSGKFKAPKPAVDKTSAGLHMPTIDINLPKLDLSLPSGSKNKNLKCDISNLDASGEFDISDPKGDIDPPKLKVKSEGSDIEHQGVSLKLPTVKMPTVDISTPKVDLDFGLTKAKGDDVKVHLLKAEGCKPSSGVSFDLPDVNLKALSFTLPRFGEKSKSTGLETSGLKGDTFRPRVGVSVDADSTLQPITIA
uniref:PDZ domain-containing protein n=1 Tax=Gouania willdenowi TaxID=441366 RepID=A0A8C5GF73_GOUWI